MFFLSFITLTKFFYLTYFLYGKGHKYQTLFLGARDFILMC